MFSILKNNHFDTLVVSTGSGVTASGLIRAFNINQIQKKRPINEVQIHSVFMSSLKSVKKILKQNNALFKNVNLYPSKFKFSDTMPEYETPFDCNEFWDKKSWWWLEKNINKIKGRILFWNLGGSFLKSINGE